MTILPMGAIPAHFASEKGEEAVCLTIANDELTWGELETQSNRFANFLRDKGVEQHEYVTVAMPNTVGFASVIFGIYKVGATPQIVSPHLPETELKAIIELADPKVVFGDCAMFLKDRNCAPTDFAAEDYSEEPGEILVAKSWKAMSSGGSTGRPKIIVSHDPAEAMIDDEDYGLKPGDHLMFCGPLYHNSPFMTGFQALFHGCKVFGPEKFDAEGTLRLIQDEKINWIVLVPTMMHRIWRLPDEVKFGYNLSSLRLVLHSAAPIASWLKRAWIDWLGADRIFEAYGGTEQTGVTFMSGQEWLDRPGTVGKFSDGTQIKIVGEQGEELPIGEVGEIYLLPKGDPNYQPFHYIGAEERRVEGGWQSIGDIGRVDEDGYLYLADRRIDLIITGGANIFPAEVEGALQEHPSVINAVVIGLPDDDLGQKAHAIIQYPPTDTAPDEADLRGFIEEKLVRYKTPRTYEFTTAPLRDEAGKVRRQRLLAERAS